MCVLLFSVIALVRPVMERVDLYLVCVTPLRIALGIACCEPEARTFHGATKLLPLREISKLSKLNVNLH